MKNLLITLIIALIPSLATGQNPDIRPSIGFTGGVQFGSGEFKTLGVQQDSDLSGFGIAADFKLPLNESTTLTLSAAIQSSKRDGELNLFFNSFESDFTQFGLSVGFRFYFGSDVNRR